jgi:thioredoxin 1
MMVPILEQMAQDFDGVAFAKFDCALDDGNKQFAVEAGIKALPTFHLYRGSQKVAVLSGAKAEKLKELVRSNLA